MISPMKRQIFLFKHGSGDTGEFIALVLERGHKLVQNTFSRRERNRSGCGRVSGGSFGCIVSPGFRGFTSIPGNYYTSKMQIKALLFNMLHEYQGRLAKLKILNLRNITKCFTNIFYKACNYDRS